MTPYPNKRTGDGSREALFSFQTGGRPSPHDRRLDPRPINAPRRSPTTAAGGMGLARAALARGALSAVADDTILVAAPGNAIDSNAVLEQDRRGGPRQPERVQMNANTRL
jgi:hypothetical protein